MQNKKSDGKDMNTLPIIQIDYPDWLKKSVRLDQSINSDEEKMRLALSLAIFRTARTTLAVLLDTLERQRNSGQVICYALF
jgi:hypothetical protein